MPQPQVIQFPFTGGVNEQIAPEYVDPSANVLDVQNGMFTHEGAIDKRLGITPNSNAQLAGDVAMGAPLGLISRGAEIVATDGDSAFSYAASGTPLWVQRGLMPNCRATRVPTLEPLDGAVSFSSAEANGRRLIVYRTGAAADAPGSIYVSLTDIVSGTVIINNSSLDATGVCPIAIWYTNSIGFSTFAVYWTDNASGGAAHIYVIEISTQGVLGSVQTVVSDALLSPGATTISFDVSPYVGGHGALILYPQKDTTGGGSSPRFLRMETNPFTITASGLLVNHAGVAKSVTICACRYDATIGTAWFAWEEYDTIAGPEYLQYAVAYAVPAWGSALSAPFLFTLPNNGSLTPATVNTLSVEPLLGNTASTAIAMLAGTPNLSPVILSSSIAYIANGNVTIWSNAYPACYFISRPFKVRVGLDGPLRCYALILFTQANTDASGAPTFSTIYLVDMTMNQFPQLNNSVTLVTQTAYFAPRIVATIAPRQASMLSPSIATLVDHRPAVVSNIGNPYIGTYDCPITIAASEEFSDPPGGVGTLLDESTWIVTLDFTQSENWSYCEGSNDAFVASGVPSYYDSSLLGELSFFLWPNNVTYAQTTGGSLTTTGVYQYAFCWAMTDAAGLIHRSAFWTTKPITLTGSNDKLNFSVDGLYFSNRFSGYWQAAGAGGTGPFLEIYRTTNNQTVLYFLTSIPAQYGQTLSWTALSFSDGASDSSITSNPLQYTTGGVMDSICPPSFQHIIRHVDRLWGIDDSGFVIWYSTQFGPSDCPYFNEALTLSFTQEPLTALGSMDDKLVVFSANSIWYVEGYGPPVTGQGSDLTTAVLIPTDVGAANWRSVLSFPGGIMFQSAQNGLIYLLDRGLSVTCIGKMVQDWFLGITVVSACLVPLTTQVRFTTDGGFTAVYDYVLQRWTQLSYVPTINDAIQPAVGTWTIAGADGYVYTELLPNSGAPYFDVLANGSPEWITTEITTADVKPGQLQGWVQFDSVQGLSRIMDPCDITVAISYDYANAPADTRTYTYADLIAQNATMGQWRLSPAAANQQPQAISVTLSDNPPTGGTATSGQGMRWLGLAFAVSTLGPRYDKLTVAVKQ